MPRHEIDANVFIRGDKRYSHLKSMLTDYVWMSENRRRQVILLLKMLFSDTSARVKAIDEHAKKSSMYFGPNTFKTVPPKQLAKARTLPPFLIRSF